MNMREALRQMKLAQAEEAAAMYAQAEEERVEAVARFVQAQQELALERERITKLEVSGCLSLTKFKIAQVAAHVCKLRCGV